VKEIKETMALSDAPAEGSRMRVAIVTSAESSAATGTIHFSAAIRSSLRLAASSALGPLSKRVSSADVVIDADGTTAIPGLIDSHVHTTFGDYTPRQKTVGFLESYLHGGVTTEFPPPKSTSPAALRIPRALRLWRWPPTRVFRIFAPAACASTRFDHYRARPDRGRLSAKWPPREFWLAKAGSAL